MIVQEQVPCMA